MAIKNIHGSVFELDHLGHPPRRVRTILWALTIVLFGVGDLVTTTTLIHHGGNEVNPFLSYFFMYLPTTITLTIAVAAQLGIAYWLYRTIDHPARLLIPILLALYGSVVTLWNLTYIASL